MGDFGLRDCQLALGFLDLLLGLKFLGAELRADLFLELLVLQDELVILVFEVCSRSVIARRFSVLASHDRNFSLQGSHLVLQLVDLALKEAFFLLEFLDAAL